MYRLNKVILHNICQFTDLELDLNVGLTAICGKNGSGKSTILHAVIFGLTGCLNGSWGSKTDLQKDGTLDPGFVSVTLVSEERTLEIKRYVSGNKFTDTLTEITSTGSTVIADKTKTVNSMLESVYGVECSILYALSWAKQGSLDAILVSTPTELYKFLSNIFSTKELDKLRDKVLQIGKTIAICSVSDIDPVETIDTKLKELEDISELEKSLDTTKSIHDKLNKLIYKFKFAKDSCITSEAKSTLMSSLIESKHKLIKDIDVLKEKTNKKPIEPDITLEILKEKHKEILSKKQNNIVNEKRRIYECNELYETYKKLKEKVNKNTDKCIVCGCDITSLNKDTYIKNILSIITNSDIGVCKNYKDVVKQIRFKYKQANTSRKNSIIENIKLKHDEEFIIQKEDEIFKFNEYVKDCSDLDNSIKSLEDIENKIKELESKKVVDVDVESKLLKLQKDILHIDNLEKDLSKKIIDITSKRNQLLYAREISEQLYKNKEINDVARAIFDIVSDVLSKKRSQSRFFKVKIEEINKRLSYYMKYTTMPFSLYLNPESFIFEYISSDGFIHPAVHLSGAQKNMASVALQMAIFDVLTPNINIFLMDEPSESMDTENKSILSNLFERMSNLLPSVEGTMLIVTRDEPIIEACEYTIQLGEKE